MKNRSRTEIVSQILQTAMGSNGARKTQIMYNAFLTYAQLKEYLTILIDKDLLDYDLDTSTFKTSEKGLRFLEIYNDLGPIIIQEEEQLL